MVWRHWTPRGHVTVLVFPKLTWGVVVRSRCQSVLYRGGNWSWMAVKIGRFLWCYRAVRSSGGWRILDCFILVLVRWGQAGWSRRGVRHRWQFQSTAGGVRLLVVCAWFYNRKDRGQYIDKTPGVLRSKIKQVRDLNWLTENKGNNESDVKFPYLFDRRGLFTKGLGFFL